MRVLLVHNHYGRFAVGGEANVMEAEAKLLESHGHTVMKYERTNAEITDGGLMSRLNAFFQVAWSSLGYEAIRKAVVEFKPDIMHVHNYWPLLTPSIFAAAKDNGVATVLTLHNYRLICPGVLFLRNNVPCELCLDGKPHRVLWHRCYTGKSLLKSYLSLRLYLETRNKGFLAPWVDAYIALTEFSRQKHIQGGLPEEKIYAKPNFTNNPPEIGREGPRDHGAIFVGRISSEKGLIPLIRAWHGVDYPLTIVGEGPLMESIRGRAPKTVRFVGQKSREEVLHLIKESAFFVFPSTCYEGFPLTLLEAMALGRAVLASDLGPRREIVRDGITGLLFNAENPEDLRRKAQLLIADPEMTKKMGETARQVYLEKYTAETNYETLMNVYQRIAKSPSN